MTWYEFKLLHRLPIQVGVEWDSHSVKEAVADLAPTYVLSFGLRPEVGIPEQKLEEILRAVFVALWCAKPNEIPHSTFRVLADAGAELSVCLDIYDKIPKGKMAERCLFLRMLVALFLSPTETLQIVSHVRSALLVAVDKV